MAWIAKYETKCMSPACQHGGVILRGQKGRTVNMHGTKTHYHPECCNLIDATSVDARIAQAVAEALQSVEANLLSKVADVVTDTPRTLIELKRHDGVKVTLKRAHSLMKQALYWVGRGRHLYLWGPAGSGKSTAAQQIAEALDRPYAYISLNPQSPASLLTGFIDASGRYVETPFYKLYKSGGVFCIDELDNASSALLTTLNGALANGHMAFPNGMVERHPDFVLVATGNTAGHGGDWHHPERRALDGATKDRLAYIFWSYDEALERELVLSNNAKAGSWLTWVRRVREFATDKANGVRGLSATPRASIEGAIDLALTSPDELPLAMVAEAHVFKGLGADVTARVLRSCPLPVDPRR